MYKYKLKDLQKRNKKLKVLKLCKVCHKVLGKRNKEGFCGQFCKSIYNGTRTVFECEYCGKKHSDKTSHYNKKEHHFCSNDCKNKWQSKNNIGENNPNYKKLEYKCDYCGKKILKTKKEYNNSQYHFCSKECFYEFNKGENNLFKKTYNLWNEEEKKQWKQRNSEAHKGKNMGENNPNYNKDAHIYIKCDYCGKEYDKLKCSIKDRKYHFCSRDCKNKWQSENMIGENHPSYKEDSHINVKCEWCNKEIKIKKTRYDNYKHNFCSQDCKNKWRSKYERGENHPQWNPTKTEEERLNDRSHPDYIEWRKAVYKRDNYKCQCCGDKKGGNLVAHHLNGYNWCKEHRTDINNGITLCENCHKELHSIYGNGNNTIEQFREFLYNKYLQTKDIKYLVALEDTDIRKYAMTLKEG